MSDVKDVGLKGRRLVAASKDWIQALSGQSQMSQPWAVTLNQNNVREGDRSCCQIPTFCPLPPPPPPTPCGIYSCTLCCSYNRYNIPNYYTFKISFLNILVLLLCMLWCAFDIPVHVVQSKASC